MISRVLRELRRRLDIPTQHPRSEHASPRKRTDRPPMEPADEELQRVQDLLDAARSAEALTLAEELSARFPQSVRVQCRYGDSLLAGGHAEQALRVFTRAIDLHPDHVPALVGQARASRSLGFAEDATDALEIAIAHDPRAAAALLELAAVHAEANAWGKVVPLLECALEIEPTRAELWVRMAAARDACEQFDAAVKAGERALAIDPDCIAAWVNLGMLHLERLANPQRAEAHFREALVRDPACNAARANLGLALQEQGRFNDAMALYEDAIEHYPDFAEFRWNRGLARLLAGNFETGWDDYEARFERDGGRARRSFPFLPWHGEPRLDGALLVYAEQGLGDEIMFASCLPDLTDRGMGVVLECSPALESLFHRSFPAIQVRGQPRGKDRSWLADYPALSRQVPIGSLPRYLRADAQRFPRHRGYLRADPVRIAKWRNRLASLGDGLKLGLAWRGGTSKTRRSQKSTTLEALLTLFDLPQVQYVCMQHDLRDDEHALLREHESKVAVWSEACSDMENAAALTAALDLTITVASTNAHLAGALGRPVWILLGASPEWRWLWEGDSTPWYPSARLWRQRRPGDWEGVASDVCQGIGRLLDARRAGHPVTGAQ